MYNWYILQTIAGSEKKFKSNLEEQIIKSNMQQYFKDIVLPIVEVPDIRHGKKIIVEKRVMPGYILVNMEMNDKSFYLVKHISKGTSFLGSKTTPQPLTKEEVQSIFKQLQQESDAANNVSIYNVGDKVTVTDGPFDSFSGIVEEVNLSTERLKISVSIFGKATPITLNFTQVTK
ncbi:transcription termination/antitermination protein NusG [Rickettsia endosymbiont of Cardiosporidium cionae]|uniref:transcription termination/antitermination protein NusG n=1 Tax=Rickettsia endosymbiont of Cardiosporidium cionae TaxID=2777155 RepID=UPI00189575B7|nr:transcription termination/antitermination protein NusG [Rickettsia endosymbiont of Cardiosporidium cionae]KAF8818626.1 transcription termination/antitermination protein NusG [Rickettsia endosymbiont of Cardiosporidium cionae]